MEVEDIEKLEEPFSSLEVTRALKRLKRGKGVGIDKVRSEMLLGGGEMLWHNLAALFNVCRGEEFIPVDWLDGTVHVVPLHKGGDSCDIGNYREITLESHIGKVFCSVQDPPPPPRARACLDLSFWSFLTFLHHGIEEVERHLL